MKTLPAAVRLLLAAVVACAGVAAAERPADWSPLFVTRFGNIDAIDAEDGDLAIFLRSIRNDGRFLPPMRSYVGPEIRNPTFYGITFEAWLECVVLVPVSVGRPERLWVFPVDSRDEYMAQLIGHGLSEYEGMDGVTILREMDADGNVFTWHMEWLPGNVVVFGSSREAVSAARHLYAENSAARGLLARPGATGAFLEPDVTVRMFPPRLAAWQDREQGLYWWRETVDKLAADLVTYWSPSLARERLIRAMADRLALMPRDLARIDLRVWFEQKGLEWSVEAEGAFASSPLSYLAALRRVPDRTALAWAMPVTADSFREFAEWVGDFFVGAAGGVVAQEAREDARSVYEILASGGLREITSAWVPPPPGTPELGGARMMVMNWDGGGAVERAWELLGKLTAPDSPIAQVFAQMGFSVELTPDPENAFTADLLVRPPAGSADDGASPYCHSTITLRRNDDAVVLVTGESREDAEARRRVIAYRVELAEQAANNSGPGGPDVRETFTRMGASGSGFAAFLEPVRFLQFCLVEEGDWRPRSPDQNEPLSIQLAREMLEYGSDRAWTAAGREENGLWTFSGSIGWRSLARLAAALGVTESIAMD
ncbi:MAG: hypothetical protein LBS30_03890 [Planctomycetota bacterium]|nr:hypothetical protein [Planctomycetota bacterium]